MKLVITLPVNIPAKPALLVGNVLMKNLGSIIVPDNNSRLVDINYRMAIGIDSLAHSAIFTLSPMRRAWLP